MDMVAKLLAASAVVWRRVQINALENHVAWTILTFHATQRNSPNSECLSHVPLPAVPLLNLYGSCRWSAPCKLK